MKKKLIVFLILIETLACSGIAVVMILYLQKDKIDNIFFDLNNFSCNFVKPLENIQN